MGMSVKGYYVSTDKLIKHQWNADKFEWITEENEAKAREIDSNLSYIIGMQGEFYYWCGEERTMHGAIEKATVYSTVEEAEGGAFLAASLDPNLAGHLRIVGEAEALKREAKNIERRAREKAEYDRARENRYRITPGEGGSGI